VEGADFCCGNGGANPIGCGVDGNDTRCIDSTAGFFCRGEPRRMACCGDALCEGQETDTSCAVDCCTPSETPEVTCNDGIDNDCDGVTDGPDGDGDGVCDAGDGCPADSAKTVPGSCGCGIADTDTDADGVADCIDNCAAVANSDQRDTNVDGFGNLCDPDYNNDLVVGIPDFNILRSQFGKRDTDVDFDPDVDANGDGAIGIPDFNVLRAYFGGPPGPSGLSCAGTVPCP